MDTVKRLQLSSIELRKTILQMIYDAGGGHTGGSLSSVDILNVLFNEVMDISPSEPERSDRDRFVMSKGHSVEGYYAVLADVGFFPEEQLQEYRGYNSKLLGHPTVDTPGVEIATGALGHGLSPGVGIARGSTLGDANYRSYVLMGDGELAEGSIWEAAMAGAEYDLDNLVGIIDRNSLEITGNTEDVMGLEPLKEKWESFGWSVEIVDGNDIRDLINIFNNIPFNRNKPNLIIAETTKGNGVSFIEGEVEWHHKVPSEEQLEQAINELNMRKQELLDGQETSTESSISAREVA